MKKAVVFIFIILFLASCKINPIKTNDEKIKIIHNDMTILTSDDIEATVFTWRNKEYTFGYFKDIEEKINSKLNKLLIGSLIEIKLENKIIQVGHVSEINYKYRYIRVITPNMTDDTLELLNNKIHKSQIKNTKRLSRDS